MHRRRDFLSHDTDNPSHGVGEAGRQKERLLGRFSRGNFLAGTAENSWSMEKLNLIARPPWTHLGRSLESACRKAIYDYKLLENVSTLAIALSGGKDSLSLLFLLKAISGHGCQPLNLYAIHVTGEFSCGAGVNEGYLRSVCDALEVPFLRRESTQKRESLECYRCSRERRRLLFEATLEVGAATIAFGHHRDDSVQTLLMNLLHKGEFTGNLAKVPMYDYGVTIIRPLIYVEEAALRTFSQHYGFHRISCQCPVGQHSKRRQVEEFLTEAEALFPNARANLARAVHNYGSNKALGS